MGRFQTLWRGLILTALPTLLVSTVSAVSIVEVPSFGSNPGNLRMFKFVPKKMNSPRALVVVIHGCLQSAEEFDAESGWTEIAERGGFALVYPEQKKENNGASCFNWFQSGDARRDHGEMLSIYEMVQKMVRDENLSKDQVYLTGFSSGGAFTAAILANYPEVFKGAAIFSGVPYGCANSLNEGYLCMNGMYKKEAKEWGDLVREAVNYKGPRPTVAIWHGTSDSVIKPLVADELVKQWTNVMGTSEKPVKEVKTNKVTYQAFASPSGVVRVEYYQLQGYKHGHPIKPGTGKENCGKVGRYVLDAGICGAYVMARTWGLITSND